jgi:hypothetical protein
MRQRFFCSTGCPLRRECSSLCSRGFAIAITLSRPITPAYVLALEPIHFDFQVGRHAQFIADTGYAARPIRRTARELRGHCPKSINRFRT